METIIKHKSYNIEVKIRPLMDGNVKETKKLSVLGVKIRPLMDGN